MKITSFDRLTLSSVRQTIEKKLAEVSKELGITVTMGNIGYTSDGTSFTTKVTGKTNGAEKVAEKHNDHIRKLFGYPPIDFEFTSKNLRFKVTGYSPRRHKFPIDCVLVSDPEMKYKFPADHTAFSKIPK